MVLHYMTMALIEIYWQKLYQNKLMDSFDGLLLKLHALGFISPSFHIFDTNLTWIDEWLQQQQQKKKKFRFLICQFRRFGLIQLEFEGKSLHNKNKKYSFYIRSVNSFSSLMSKEKTMKK